MKIQNSLITVALAFVMLFGMAFQCGQNDGSRSEGKSRQANQTTRQTSATNELTKEFVMDYIKRREKESVENERPSVSVTLNFETVRFGTPYKYEIDSGLIRDIVIGETVYPVKGIYTRTRESASESKTVTQEWDYLFYKDVNGKWTSSASLVR